MSLYALLFVLFIAQEPISTDAVLLEAYQNHYNVWIIHALFVVATLLDIAVGYVIGVWLKRTFSDNSFLQKIAGLVRSYIGEGTYGEYFFLFFWSWTVFPLVMVVAPWLGIPFRKTFYVFLGDLIFWYGSEWLIVLGVRSTIPNPLAALYGVVIVSVLVVLGTRYLRRK